MVTDSVPERVAFIDVSSIYSKSIAKGTMIPDSVSIFIGFGNRRGVGNCLYANAKILIGQGWLTGVGLLSQADENSIRIRRLFLFL